MSKFYHPKLAIFLFIFITITLIFYDSNRVIMWGTQGNFQKQNFFLSLALSYAKESEKIKQKLGLSDFFKKEGSFWKDLKKSPLIFQAVFVKESTQEPVKEIEKPKEEIIKEIEKEKEVKDKVEVSEKKKEEQMLPYPITYSQYRFLIIGDSFIAVRGGLGEILERDLLTYKDVTVVRVGKVSSGLSRPDYFNWELKTIELISQYSPNIAIVMLSSNDAQSILTPNGILVANYGKENWNQEYAKRVSNLLDIFEKNNITVFWIGFPIMRDQIFSNKIKNLNSIYEKESQKKENIHFFSTWELLADENGKYVTYLPDEQGIYRALRQSDGIHLTYFGGKIVVDKFIKKMKEIIKLEPKAKTEP